MFLSWKLHILDVERVHYIERLAWSQHWWLHHARAKLELVLSRKLSLHTCRRTWSLTCHIHLTRYLLQYLMLKVAMPMHFTHFISLIRNISGCRSGTASRDAIDNFQLGLQLKTTAHSIRFSNCHYVEGTKTICKLFLFCLLAEGRTITVGEYVRQHFSLHPFLLKTNAF